jgi:hypothetical protein
LIIRSGFKGAVYKSEGKFHTFDKVLITNIREHNVSVIWIFNTSASIYVINSIISEVYRGWENGRCVDEVSNI